MDKETITVEGTTRITISMAKGILTTIKAISLKATPKEMPPPLETPQMHVFNVEKWDTSPGTAQNTAKAINITKQLTSLGSFKVATYFFAYPPYCQISNK